MAGPNKGGGSRKPPSIPFSHEADVTRLANKVTAKDVRAKLNGAPTVAESLHVASPGGNKAAGLKPFSTPDGAKFEAPLAKLRPYDRNPRRAANAAFAVIKTSLAATGPASLELWVTQRPGSETYMPYRGGNTRLAAVLELAQEGDARWQRLVVTYKQWVSEADTLAQHLIENNNRADMSFWDKACAYLVEMRAEIEQELGSGTLSLRRLEEEFARRGVGVKKSHLSLFQFAVQRLSVAGPHLSSEQVRQLQPAINQMLRLTEKFGLEDAEFQALLDGACKAALEGVAAALEGVAAADGEGESGLRASEIIAAAETALATRLDTSPVELRRWLDTLNRFPDISLDDLRRPVATQDISRERVSRQPATHEPPPSQPSPPPAAVPAWQPEEGRATDSSPTHPPPAPPADDAPSSEPGAAMGQYERVQAPSSAPPSAPAERPPRPALSRFQAVTALAEAAGVSDCLRQHDALPAGFYVEPPTYAIDVDANCPDSAVRIIAWQLLSVLSGQWEETVARLLPVDSLWRRMRLAEGGLDHEALPMYVQDQLLVEVGQQALEGASDLGWGVLVPMGWVVRLLTDPACSAVLGDVLQHFSREQT